MNWKRISVCSGTAPSGTIWFLRSSRKGKAFNHKIQQQGRERHALQVLGLYRDAAQYRRVTRDGLFERDGFERSRALAPRGPELGR